MLCLQRSAPIDEIKGRTIYGPCLTYGRAYNVTDDYGASWYREGFRVRAFAKSIDACRNTFELRRLHDTAQRVGVVSFDDSEPELRYRAIIDGTDLGDAALADVQAGKLGAVSVAFRPRSSQPDSEGVRWRHVADMRELSVTTRGQYPEARVEGLRSKSLTVVRSEITVALATIAERLSYV